MFLIGEFSKISRVSKRMLHYYDNIGLLKPAQIDQLTGYRYYHARQLPRLNRILALKELGLTLEQVKEMLQVDISDEEISGMLLLKKAEAEQAVMEESQRLRQIEARLEQNKLADEPLDIVIKSVEKRPFLSVRAILASPEETMALIDQLLHIIPAQVSASALGHFAGVFYSDGFTDYNNDAELGYFLKKPVEKPVLLNQDYIARMHELPAVATMATCVQIAGADRVLIGMGKIAHWIEKNGYRIAGPYREIGYDVTSITDLIEAVIEIQMPVEKANPKE